MATRRSWRPKIGSPEIEFCVHGQPVSAQATRRQALQAWKRLVADACRAAWSYGRPPLQGDLTVRVTVYRDAFVGDVDNLTKPVLDALQGIVYDDDRQLSDVTAARRDINGRFRIRRISLALAEAFSNGEQFVHVRVYRAPKRRDLG